MDTRLRSAIFCAVIGLLATTDSFTAREQNLINHNTPIAQSITGLQPKGLDIRLLPTPQIIAYFQDSTGKEEVFAWPCALGTCTDDTSAEVLTTINALNTVNLSTNSLLRRVSQKVCTDFPSRFSGGCTVP